MTIEDYSSKSSINRSPATKEKQEITPVVKHQVTTKKKSFIKGLADTFLAEDLPTIGGYLLNDVIIPNTKDVIVDIVRNSIEMLMYGECKPKGKSGSNYAKVSYTDYFKKDDKQKRASGVKRFNLDDIYFETRQDADEVLTRMIDYLETYNFVSVAEMKDFAGLDTEWTDNKWGWSNLSSAYVTRQREGYCLKLPKVEAYDK